MSSIKEASNKPRNIINSILMSFNHPDGKRKNLIIEGKTDIKLLKNFINEEQVKVRSVTGKDNVLKVMNGFPVSNKHFMHAVADADFDHILDKFVGVLLVVFCIVDYVYLPFLIILVHYIF